MWQCPKCGREFKNTHQDHYCGNVSDIDAITPASKSRKRCTRDFFAQQGAGTRRSSATLSEGRRHWTEKDPCQIPNIRCRSNNIAKQPEDAQPILHKIRAVIREATPDAVVKISWQMPTFWPGENLIRFAAFKKHVGIYPGNLSLAPFAEKLTGYRHTKGPSSFRCGRKA